MSVDGSDALADIDAAIREHALTTSYGERLALEGVATVALDEDGNLLRHNPDGSVTPLT